MGDFHESNSTRGFRNPRNAVRGCVRPSVFRSNGPLVRRPIRLTRVSQKSDIRVKIEQKNIKNTKRYRSKDYTKISTRAERQNATDVGTPSDLKND